jgi:hypothetical protein
MSSRATRLYDVTFQITVNCYSTVQNLPWEVGRGRRAWGTETREGDVFCLMTLSLAKITYRLWYMNGYGHGPLDMVMGPWIVPTLTRHNFWRRRQYVRPKRQCQPTTPHSVKTQKDTIWKSPSVENWQLHLYPAWTPRLLTGVSALSAFIPTPESKVCAGESHGVRTGFRRDG